MAAPAISGLVANLLYVNNNLTFNQIFTIVTNSRYSTSLNSCKNTGNEGDCNGIQMTCDELITAAQNGGKTDSDGYTCSDGCTISTAYVNDDWCDCTDCGDENEWTCEDCENGCSDSCGTFRYCGAGRSVQSNNMKMDEYNKLKEEENLASKQIMIHVDNNTNGIVIVVVGGCILFIAMIQLYTWSKILLSKLTNNKDASCMSNGYQYQSI